MIFEKGKNKKKVGRRGWGDPAAVSAHSAGKERSKGGTKYLRYLDSKRISSTRLEAKGLGGLFCLYLLGLPVTSGDEWGQLLVTCSFSSGAAWTTTSH